MSLPRPCLEKAIPSYSVAQSNREIALADPQELTRRWRNDCRADYELCVSQVVASEAARGDPELMAARMAKLEGGQ